jgi:hypothetical protein
MRVQWLAPPPDPFGEKFELSMQLVRRAGRLRLPETPAPPSYAKLAVIAQLMMLPPLSKAPPPKEKDELLLRVQLIRLPSNMYAPPPSVAPELAVIMQLLTTAVVPLQ